MGKPRKTTQPRKRDLIIDVTQFLPANSNSTTPANTTAMAITLMIGSFVAILNQTLMISALPTLMHEFDVPSSTVQWLTTGFMLTNGIMIPITAFLIETFTTRQLFLYAMGIFAE